MRVLILALSLGDGGVARYIEEVALNLGRIGNRTVLLYIGKEDRTDNIEEGLKVVQISSTGSGLIGRVRSIVRLLLISRKLIEEDDLDTYMGNTPFSNIFGHILSMVSPKRLKKVRIVHGMWALEVSELPEARKVYGFKTMEKTLPLLAGILESWELKRSHVIIAVSDQIRNYIVELTGRNDVAVVTAGVDTSKFSPATDKEKVRKELGVGSTPMVLSVGVICKRKGLDILIEAAAKAAESRILNLIIVGGGLELNNYRSMVNLKGYDFISFTGKVSDDVLIKYYQAADLYCLTSYLEGMPQTLLEAMSSGLACISTDVGGISTLIRPGKNGILIPPGDINALSENMLLMLEDDGLRRSYGEAARASVIENFSWQTICERISKLVEG